MMKTSTPCCFLNIRLTRDFQSSIFILNMAHQCSALEILAYVFKLSLVCDPTNRVTYVTDTLECQMLIS